MVIFAAAHALTFSIAPRSYSSGATKTAAKLLLEAVGLSQWQCWCVLGETEMLPLLISCWKHREMDIRFTHRHIKLGELISSLVLPVS